MNQSGSAGPASLTLSIVQLDHSIGQIDRPIVDTTTRLLDHLQCSTPAGEDFNQRTAKIKKGPQLREKVEKSIMRYRRDEDRWTSLTSLLLKSLAFYRSQDSSTERLGEWGRDGASAEMGALQIRHKNLPILDLPRTKYHRPYLPRLGWDPANSPIDAAKEEGEVDENYHSMMNVSHQYPWVCMAQQQLRATEATSKPTLLGVDLVIFDARLGKYTPTINDFLKSFVRSYTPWEWERINHYRKTDSWSIGNLSARRRSEESRLREFFLRWSMKEAYTKALGKGMHIEFDEFETKLCGVDIAAGNPSGGGRVDGIWETIRHHSSHRGEGSRQLSVTGKVRHTKSPLQVDSWEFIFIPLGGGIMGSNIESTPIACTCICRGPLPKDAPGLSVEKNPTTIEILTLVDLIQSHGSNPL